MFPDEPRVVIDTGVLISRFLRAQSIPAQAVALAQNQATILLSEETAAEFLAVLTRPKFAAYVDADDALAAVTALAGIAELVPVARTVTACRDPSDDKFLVLAISGGAHAIVSGDEDLLTLHPFQGVAILTPRQFLDALQGPPTR